ncbi:MAG: hypothetical protein RIS44_1565 [Pseudomonadota bacterium]|jgi:UDP-glucose 4-epimerase
MTLAWVLGQGGLLGNALASELTRQGTRLFSPPYPIAWDDPPWWLWQMRQAAKRLALSLSCGEPWVVYWAAGVGTMSSSADEMALETRALTLLLDALNEQTALKDGQGTVVLASSAGALHTTDEHAGISETSPPNPNSAYGHAKLSHEIQLAHWAHEASGRQVLLARLSNLYGPGQAWGKRQGLISHMARCMLRHQPIHIYVPLGTLRDYLYADDAARAMVHAARTMPAHTPVARRLVCSEHAVSVAEIIGTFTRLTRRAPRIVTSAARATALYPARIVFRSSFQNDRLKVGHTPLTVGVSRVLESERQRLSFGEFAATFKAVVPADARTRA